MTNNEKLHALIKKSGLTQKEFVKTIPPLIVKKTLSREMLMHWLYAKHQIPDGWMDLIEQVHGDKS